HTEAPYRFSWKQSLYQLQQRFNTVNGYGFSTLLAEHHHNLTPLDEVLAQYGLASLVAGESGMNSVSWPRPEPNVSRCGQVARPSTGPSFFAAAICTALSPGTAPPGWSAPRGCWSGPAD